MIISERKLRQIVRETLAKANAITNLLPEGKGEN